MFDAHVHLDFLEPAAREEFLRRSQARGVVCFAIPGVSPSQWPVAAEIASLTKGAVWGVGVHPEFASRKPVELSALIEQARPAFAIEPAFVGEAGLDARLEHTFDANAQEALFLSHIELAEELRLPLVVHVVRRNARMLELIMGHDVPGIVHGFIGSYELAKRFVDRGWGLGVGRGAQRSPKTSQALRQVPLSSVFVESDEPSEESDVGALVDWLGVLRGVGRSAVADATYLNALEFFGTARPPSS